jgi:DNA primase
MKKSVMDYTGNSISLTQIRQIDLVNYLSRIGHEPVRVRNGDYWYLSPLRNEKIASFKVNRRINRWYDHGMGKGGNLIDFGTLYYQCTVGEFVRQMPEGMTAPRKRPSAKIIEEDKESRILITGEYDLTSGALLQYLRERRIPVPVARTFCTEVSFTLHHKKYYGIGFKNDSGGYEIRNRHFKAGNSPKDMTTIRHHATEAVVFEGFMDFLSFQASQGGQRRKKYDFVILNSLAFFERARPFMESHEKIHLFLDNDAAGERCRMQALLLSARYQDQSRLYAGYKDFNDWLINFGTAGIRPQKRHT